MKKGMIGRGLTRAWVHIPARVKANNRICQIRMDDNLRARSMRCAWVHVRACVGSGGGVRARAQL